MTTNPLTLFGRRIVELRKARGWSQEKLAHECGLSRSYLGGIEQGRRNLALQNIYKLARTLGVEPYELLIAPQADGDLEVEESSV